jgi:hypothetical protein
VIQLHSATLRAKAAAGVVAVTLMSTAETDSLALAAFSATA